MKGYLKYIGFLVVIGLLVAWFVGAFKHKEPAYLVEGQKRTVQGLKVGSPTLSQTRIEAFSGSVVADQTAHISTRIMGKVQKVYVKEGDFVKAGQLLVSVDASDVLSQASAVEKQITQAQEAYKAALANYEAVKKTYERYEALLKEGAVTQQEFDQVKAQYEAALAGVRQAQAGIEALKYQRQAVASNLNYATLRAPFSGYVTVKNVNEGDIAVPGQPLLTLEKSPYKVEFYLPERYLGKIKPGQIFDVQVDPVGVVKGRVVEVSPALDPMSRTFRVKLLLEDNPSVRSGMYAKLLIPEEGKTILVPESAIYRRHDFTGVFVVRPDNTLELRFVKLGQKVGDMVEVLSGLEGNERIVIEGVEKACDGCRIGG
ncbi:efflux RND transporter periplasmic adaptor subunit [Thermocrinis minervae]|uniref:RND family efflux transporter, MFP subunit n=1 Tax=Thermocrinis minervae TaxID=381751 RepID=A0A1M6QKZ8_9AQUI|nr:efflux RND transporter periplasmic adaptor subunit [Thermocrinis minervae]SHK20896.1 RND family efflux transporter, MFP subunit [Thermocrinis minervae]